MLSARPLSADGLFDALTAPLIGGAMGGSIAIIRFLELDRHLPRYLTAMWLLCAVLAGNFLTNYWVYNR